MVNNISDLNLTWWQKEDLEELNEKYPGFFNKSLEELEYLQQQLNWKAEAAYDTVQKLESEAAMIELYMNAIRERKNNY